MAILIIYFPVTAACYDGLRNTPQAWLDLAKTFNPSPLRLLLKVRLPAALPAFASGFRIAVSVAPIGAVIGEWVGSSEGLGYLMIPRQRSYAGGFNVCRVADISGNFTLFIFQHRLATTSFYLARLTLHDKRRQK